MVTGTRWVLLGAAAAVGLLGIVAAAPPEPPRHRLAEPEYLPEAARGLLKQRMGRHSQDVTELVLSVTLLKYPEAATVATRIATEPRLVRPIVGGEHDLNAALPERFFVLQDEIRLRARALADSAKAQDDVALAKAFGRLTETCIACHSAYLKGPTPEQR